MDYRIARAETDEEREKEKAFMGLGLTSRKNLCIHPEACQFLVDRWLAINQSEYTGLQREKGENSGC